MDIEPGGRGVLLASSSEDIADPMKNSYLSVRQMGLKRQEITELEVPDSEEMI